MRKPTKLDYAIYLFVFDFLPACYISIALKMLLNTWRYTPYVFGACAVMAILTVIAAKRKDKTNA